MRLMFMCIWDLSTGELDGGLANTHIFCTYLFNQKKGNSSNLPERNKNHRQ